MSVLKNPHADEKYDGSICMRGVLWKQPDYKGMHVKNDRTFM